MGNHSTLFDGEGIVKTYFLGISLNQNIHNELPAPGIEPLFELFCLS